MQSTSSIFDPSFFNTFTAQNAALYSKAELHQFWTRILFSKHSDSILQLLGKAPSCSFISFNTPDFDANSPHQNPHNTLRIGLQDRLINLTPLFTPTWFSDAFIALFGYPCYILTQCGIMFSTFLFIPATITFIIELYTTISNDYNHKQNITIFSSIPHCFFKFLTTEMVNDFNDTHHHKPKLALKSSKLSPLTHVIDNSLDDFSNSNAQTNHFTIPTGIISLPPFCTKRPEQVQ